MKAVKYTFMLVIFLVLFSFQSLFAAERILRLKDSTLIGMDLLAADIKAGDIIFVGEIHGDKQHHVNQLKVIQKIHESGIPVAVGLEMFQMEDQRQLDSWVADESDVVSFQEFYKKNWTLPWTLYKDIFVYARDSDIPMFGINVSREMINEVSQKGLDALTPEMREKYPEVETDIDPRYREFIRKAYDIHGYKEESSDSFYMAQVLWDAAMAGNILRFKEQREDYALVIIAGDGHAWKPGIPSQIAKQSPSEVKVILPKSGILNMENVTYSDTDYLWLDEWIGENLPLSEISRCAGANVLFDQGHGQRFVVEGNDPLDITGLSWIFQKSGFLVKITKQELDDNLLATADVLLISGPFKPLSTLENEAIVKFVKEGGRLCIMLHVPFPLTDLLHEIGVASSNGVIFERENLLGGNPQNFRVDRLEAHPLTDGLEAFNIHGAWAVTNIRGNAKVIAATSPSAWVDLNRDRELGPNDAVQSLGITVAGEYGKGRFVVFGDDAIFQNQFLTRENLKLAENLVRWLCGNLHADE